MLLFYHYHYCKCLLCVRSYFIFNLLDGKARYLCKGCRASSILRRLSKKQCNLPRRYDFLVNVRRSVLVNKNRVIAVLCRTVQTVKQKNNNSMLFWSRISFLVLVIVASTTFEFWLNFSYLKLFSCGYFLQLVNLFFSLVN